MKLLSINVGAPKEFEYEGKIVSTSIFKSAVDDSRNVSFLNIEGDLQSDLINHGGVDKAVYSYDLSNYAAWKKSFSEWNEWSLGLFGENLTTEGLTDENVRIGSIYEIGTVKLRAIQPRFPCFKLNIRFGRKRMIEKFYDMNRFGTYFRVIKEGRINQGDEIRLIEESPVDLTISDVTHCKTSKGSDQEKLILMLDSPWIPEKLKENVKMYVR